MSRHRRAPVRIAGALLFAQALFLTAQGGGAPNALAEAPAAQPGPENRGYKQKDFADLDQGAARALARCDTEDTRRRIAQMREAADVAMKTADAMGTPELKADAGLLRFRAAEYEVHMRRCGRRHLAASPDAGQSYGFQSAAVAETMRSLLQDAAKAAADCKTELYEQAIKTIETFADNLESAARSRGGGLRTGTGAYADPQAEQQRQDAQLASMAAGDLKRTQQARFAHCAKEEPKRTSLAPRPLIPSNDALAASAPISLEPLVAIIRENQFYGEVSLGAGPGNLGGGEVSYRSSGAQSPFSSKGDALTAAILCGEIAFWYNLFADTQPAVAHQLRVGNPMLGVALLFCGNTGESVTLYDIARHGPGTVRFELNERFTLTVLAQARIVLWAQLDAIFGAEPRREANAAPPQYAATDSIAQAAPRSGRWWPIMITAGIGPSFVSSKLTLSSDQSFFGGGVPTASDSYTATGFTFRIGVATPLCGRCAFGRPLLAGIDGTFTWMPSRELSVRSTSFGFTETARVGERLNTTVIFKLSVPFGLLRR